MNIHYKDKVYLEEESLEARQMGFTGKQAIHPSQVDVIQSTFLPSAEGTCPPCSPSIGVRTRN